jgi:thioester reductase-like protein
MTENSTRGPAGVAGVGDNVFLTGGTGFLGAEIMKRILRSHPKSRLTLLVRSTHRETARERVDRQLLRSFGQEEASRYRQRVDVVNGDISLRGLGMDSDRVKSLQSGVDQVIHCAATIRFDLPLDVARRDNTEGTRNVLTFAEGIPRLRRLDYVGTAYIAGDREGLVKEDELDVGQKFSNSYEQTKMEAETLVREFAQGHPAAIYRPSIVVGDSRTGETTSFQGFYQALIFYRQLYSKGIFFRAKGRIAQAVSVLPADPNAIIDLVPIDYVVDALFGLMHLDKSIGRVFHLTSGPGSTCTWDELMRMTAEFTQVPPPGYISRSTWQYVLRPFFHAVVWGKRRDPMLKADKYFPYAWTKFMFDKTNTNSLLEGTGITTPHARSYFVKLLEYQARTLKLG